MILDRYAFTLATALFGALLLFLPATAAAQIVQGGSTTGLRNFDFEAVPNPTTPRTPYRRICGPGVTIGERLHGQTTAQVGDFDLVSGAPDFPLGVDDPASENHGVSVWRSSSNVLAGEGTQGWPHNRSLGEGAVSIVFSEDQEVIGFDILGANLANKVHMIFYDRPGNQLGTLTVQHPSKPTGRTPVSFTSTTGPIIAAVTINNDDPAGVAYDNLRYRFDEKVVRLSIKRVLDRHSNPDPFWTTARIQQFVQDTNDVFSKHAHITFRTVEIVDLVDPGVPNSWFLVPKAENKTAMEVAAERNPCAFKWRADAINVYLCKDIVDAGGVCSFASCPANDNDIVIVNPFILNDGIGLAHELGHYFNLRHTHANHEGSTCGCPGGKKGDCVPDTHGDADPDDCDPFSTACHEANLRALGYDPHVYDRIRLNVMSYHGGLTTQNALFTCGQVDRMHLYLRLLRRKVLVGEPVPTITGVTPAAGEYPGPRQLTLTGTDLPTGGGLTVTAGELESASASGNATTITAGFTEAVEPGVHCVTLLRNKSLIAFKARGVAITPSLEKPVDLPGGVLDLTFSSTAPHASMLVAAGQRIPPIPLLPALFTLQVNPLTVFPITTNAGARSVQSFPITTVPKNATVVVQALELAAGQPKVFSNAVTIVIP